MLLCKLIVKSRLLFPFLPDEQTMAVPGFLLNNQIKHKNQLRNCSYCTRRHETERSHGQYKKQPGHRLLTEQSFSTQIDAFSFRRAGDARPTSHTTAGGVCTVRDAPPSLEHSRELPAAFTFPKGTPSSCTISSTLQHILEDWESNGCVSNNLWKLQICWAHKLG